MTHNFKKEILLKNVEYMINAIKYFEEIIAIDVDEIRNNIYIIYEFERILYISDNLKSACMDKEIIINMMLHIENAKAKIDYQYVKPENTKAEMKLMLSFMDNIKIIQKKIDRVSLEKVLQDNKIDEATKYLFAYKTILHCEIELSKCSTLLWHLRLLIQNSKSYPIILNYKNYVNGLLDVKRAVRLGNEYKEYTYDIFLRDYKKDYFKKFDEAYFKKNANTVIV